MVPIEALYSLVLTNSNLGPVQVRLGSILCQALWNISDVCHSVSSIFSKACAHNRCNLMISEDLTEHAEIQTAHQLDRGHTQYSKTAGRGFYTDTYSPKFLSVQIRVCYLPYKCRKQSVQSRSPVTNHMHLC